MYARAYICMYVCVFVCMYVYLYVCTRVCAYNYVSTYVCVPACLCLFMPVFPYIRLELNPLRTLLELAAEPSCRPLRQRRSNDLQIHERTHRNIECNSNAFCIEYQQSYIDHETDTTYPCLLTYLLTYIITYPSTDLLTFLFPYSLSYITTYLPSYSLIEANVTLLGADVRHWLFK